MSNLYWNTVTPDMRVILKQFSNTPTGAKFYLAGGTALSLQLGHRLSVDLDFFSPSEDIPSIRPALEQALASFDFTLADSAWGNLVYLVQNVRIGFYGYGYDLVAPLVETPDARLASIEDIALMKLDALLARAARKDFYDLYFICQKISLRQVLDHAPKKYPHTRDFEAQSVKRLTYFESADQDPDPTLLYPVAWNQVKEYFTAQAREIGRGWIE
jgi:predicted nucleotidyltransferase component of viral defense system